MLFKTLNENLVAYRHRSGAGPVVVFANSLGSDQSIWDSVIAALVPHRSILTYDLRGQGASGVTEAPYTIDLLADDLIALLDHLDMRQVILCGVSIGGMIAQLVAVKRPDLIRGLVLSTTAARIGSLERWETRIVDVRAGGLEGLAQGILDQWFPRTFQAENPDAIAGYAGMLRRNSSIGYANTCAALRDADLTDNAAQISAPCVCIAGGQDGSVDPVHVAHLAALIDGARLMTLTDTGHLPCLDAPQEVAFAITALITETAPIQDRASAGMAVRRAVLGDAHVDRAERNKSDFDTAFQALVTEGAWGTVWASDAISLRERSMITLALLAALGNFDEIPMHIRATASTGATQSDIREVFQHVAIYAGVPRANHALRLAKQTLAEMVGRKL
ncbi:MAG: 3-oxoadipate enol-lactonase/4-carboxymuconolactone decarboxylase [Yoonia sp.]|jgi:3-oxoadipate enol-lactonase/4-carboxymuconolactone decarboxylase